MQVRLNYREPRITKPEPDVPDNLTQREPKSAMIASPAADNLKPLQIGLSSQCIFVRARHERKETRPPSLGFALDESDRENIGRARDAHDEGC